MAPRHHRRPCAQLRTVAEKSMPWRRRTKKDAGRDRSWTITINGPVRYRMSATVRPCASAVDGRCTCRCSFGVTTDVHIGMLSRMAHAYASISACGALTSLAIDAERACVARWPTPTSHSQSTCDNTVLRVHMMRRNPPALPSRPITPRFDITTRHVHTHTHTTGIGGKPPYGAVRYHDQERAREGRKVTCATWRSLS